MLKRAPSLTNQAKVHLKQRIVNDEFADGRIPSEADLARELNVSRSTIREALSQLEAEGAIFRKQGSGTFVNETGLQIKIRLEEIWDYESVLLAHGYQPSTQILSVEEEQASADIAADLNVEVGASLVVIQKLFLAGSDPVILTSNHVPSALFNQDYTNEACGLPISQFLSQFCNQQLDYFFSEAVPLLAPDWLIDALNISPPKAILSFNEIGYNEANQPIVKGSSYFRDDLLRFSLIRRQGSFPS